MSIGMLQLTAWQHGFSYALHNVIRRHYARVNMRDSLHLRRQTKNVSKNKRLATGEVLVRRTRFYHYSTAHYPLGGAYLIQVKGLGGGWSHKQHILWGEARILGWHACETLSAHGRLHGGSSPQLFGWVDVGWMCGRADEWMGGWKNKTKQAAYKTMLSKQQTRGMKMLLRQKQLHMMLV